MKSITLNVTLLLLLTSCGSVGYKKYGGINNTGYQEERLAQNRFQVMFQGNGYDTPLSVRRCLTFLKL